MTDFVAFFVVVNPIKVAPLFVVLTQGATPAERRVIARRAVVIAAIIGVLFIIGGQLLLDALGIGVASFRIAGGLILLVISMRMILEEEPTADKGSGAGSAGPKPDVAVFPLATPFIVGPGTLLTAVVLTDNTKFNALEQFVTTVVLIAVLALTYILLLSAGAIDRLLKPTGVNVLTRIFGMILAALSVQIVLDGIRATFSLR